MTPQKQKQTIRWRVFIEDIIFMTLVFAVAGGLFYYLDFWLAVAINYIFLFLAVTLLAFHRASMINQDLQQIRQSLMRYKQNIMSQSSNLNVSTREIDELGNELKGFILHLQSGERTKRKTDQEHCQYNNEMTAVLSHFMYYISHVLRTPLNSIRWAVEMLKNEEAGHVTKEQRELLDQLENDSVKLASVASELQDTLVVIRGRKIRARPAVCHPFSIIDKVAGLWAVPAHRKNLQLIWERPREPIDTFQADCGLIQKALNFVVDNAVRYTPENKSIKIDITILGKNITQARRRKLALPAKVKKPGLVISVADQGIGIPKKEQANIFEPFFRASNAKDQWVDAKGLGLTLARAILDQHSGQIWVKSELGRGTTAHIYIPYKR